MYSNPRYSQVMDDYDEDRPQGTASYKVPDRDFHRYYSLRGIIFYFVMIGKTLVPSDRFVAIYNQIDWKCDVLEIERSCNRTSVH